MLQALAQDLRSGGHGLLGVPVAPGDLSPLPAGRSPSGSDFLLPRCNFYPFYAHVYSFRFHRPVGNVSPWSAKQTQGCGPAGRPSLPPLSIAIACCTPVFGSPSCPSQHHCDWVLHCGTAKFICCQALYIPHNSASQALLCMCLIFTIKKTNGENDSQTPWRGGSGPASAEPGHEFHQ